MREILFRGKRVDNGEWVEGSLLKVTLDTETYYLIFGDEFLSIGADVRAMYHACVDPETVGQCTGLTDKNGKKIFEGDIIPVYEQGEEYNYKIVYNGDCFMLAMLDSEQGSYPLSTKNTISEVIGNIHDNPELLKGGE